MAKHINLRALEPDGLGLNPDDNTSSVTLGISHICSMSSISLSVKWDIDGPYFIELLGGWYKVISINYPTQKHTQ